MEELDLPNLRRIVARFEKALAKNQELRARYPQEPNMYYASFHILIRTIF
jgi:hypothetical protein